MCNYNSYSGKDLLLKTNIIWGQGIIIIPIIFKKNNSKAVGSGETQHNISGTVIFLILTCSNLSTKFMHHTVEANL